MEWEMITCDRDHVIDRDKGTMGIGLLRKASSYKWMRLLAGLPILTGKTVHSMTMTKQLGDIIVTIPCPLWKLQKPMRPKQW